MAKLVAVDALDAGFEEHAHSLRDVLGVNTEDIPWHLVLSKKEFAEWCRRAVEHTQEVVLKFLHERYGDTFLANGEFLRGLEHARIDLNVLQGYMESEDNSTVRGTLASFVPGEDGYTETIGYSQIGTSTGRLIVKAGPQVLTLPKKYKDIIKSRYRDGKVYQVDFVALEPRVARLIAGGAIPRDIYEGISREMFEGELTREEVKLAVLCALYGISVRRLKNMLGDRVRPRQIIKKIRSYFGVDQLADRLRSQLGDRGYIDNFYGRRLALHDESENIMISHFLQSSAVDVALLGFSELISEAHCAGLKLHPLFIIHDALLVDVCSSADRAFEELVATGVQLDNLGSFPLSLDVVSRST